MQTKETIDGNKIIAEYEGKIIVADLSVRLNPSHYYLLELKYRKSWDWLMPVWSKILNECIYNRLAGKETQEQYKKMEEAEWHQICTQGLATAEIDLFWAGIIDGIKWLNDRKKIKS